MMDLKPGQSVWFVAKTQSRSILPVTIKAVVPTNARLVEYPDWIVVRSTLTVLNRDLIECGIIVLDRDKYEAAFLLNAAWQKLRSQIKLLGSPPPDVTVERIRKASVELGVECE